MSSEPRRRCNWCVALLLLVMQAACHPSDPPTTPRLPERSGGPVARGGGAAIVEARSIRVQDGDSFVARMADGGSITIRLSGIDAPERGQPLADRARENLQFLLTDRLLQLRIVKVDAYDRAVAQVAAVGDGTAADVGLAQLEAGLAWFFRRYRKDLPQESVDSYELAEQAARAAGRGLWQSGRPEPPWEFRQRQQQRNRRASP